MTLNGGVGAVIADDDGRSALVRFASLPRTSSRSVSRISPRSIGQPVADRAVPGSLLAGRCPFVPSGGVVLFQFRVAQQPNRVVERGRP